MEGRGQPGLRTRCANVEFNALEAAVQRSGSDDLESEIQRVVDFAINVLKVL